MITLTSEYKKKLKILAKSFAENIKNPGKKFSLFSPMIGKNYSPGGLLVIGRACNGWGFPWEKNEINEETLEQSISFSEKDQMDWLKHAWEFEKYDEGTIQKLKKKYFLEKEETWNWLFKDGVGKTSKIRRSAFWRVIKKLNEKITGQENSPDWPYQIAWSNLYKISPTGSGNPLSSEIKLMRKQSKELIQMEIEILKPKIALIVTGIDWFNESFEEESQPFSAEELKKIVQKTFKIGKSKVIITSRPEKKVGDLFCSQVEKAF